MRLDLNVTTYKAVNWSAVSLMRVKRVTDRASIESCTKSNTTKALNLTLPGA